MSFEKQFNDMIEAGRNVIDTDFDPAAFQHWRAHVITYLSSLMEPDYAYAKYFIKPFHIGVQSRTPKCGCEKRGPIARDSRLIVRQIKVDLRGSENKRRNKK